MRFDAWWSRIASAQLYATTGASDDVECAGQRIHARADAQQTADEDRVECADGIGAVGSTGRLSGRRVVARRVVFAKARSLHSRTRPVRPHDWANISSSAVCTEEHMPDNIIASTRGRVRVRWRVNAPARSRNGAIRAGS